MRSGSIFSFVQSRLCAAAVTSGAAAQTQDADTTMSVFRLGRFVAPALLASLVQALTLSAATAQDSGLRDAILGSWQGEFACQADVRTDVAIFDLEGQRYAFARIFWTASGGTQATINLVPPGPAGDVITPSLLGGNSGGHPLNLRRGTSDDEIVVDFLSCRNMALKRVAQADADPREGVWYGAFPQCNVGDIEGRFAVVQIFPGEFYIDAELTVVSSPHGGYQGLISRQGFHGTVDPQTGAGTLKVFGLLAKLADGSEASGTMLDFSEIKIEAPKDGHIPIAPGSCPASALSREPAKIEQAVEETPDDSVWETVWEGRAECADGPRFYRLSIEPGEKKERPRVVIDFLDAPGGLPWARGTGTNFFSPPLISPFPANWIIRPFVPPQWPDNSVNVILELSNDQQTLTSLPYGDCQGLVLKRMPRDAATGGISSAEQLPSSLVGRIGCENNSWFSPLKLTLAGDGEAGVEGTLTWSNGSKFSLFGEFDPETGTVTLVGDRWIDQMDTSDVMLDFKGVLRDRGQRLVARANWPNCGLIDVAVPGTDIAARVTRPLSPRPILEWDDASACVTLIEWASQAVPQIGGKSFYTDVMSSEYERIGLALFADSRFVPFFGKPFEKMSGEEKKHVVDLTDYCERLTAFGEPMRHKGASGFVEVFFPGNRQDLALVATRYRMMQGRLAKEMRALDAKTVGEADIPDLQARLGELDTRFAGLWDVDLASARSLIERKLEAARGEMAARLEVQIAGLSTDDSAFAAEASLRADIAALGEDRRAEQERLAGLLNARLGNAADALLTALVEDLSTLEPTLGTFESLRTRLNALWPRLEGYVARDGAAFAALRDYTGALAASAFPEFKTRVTGMMERAQSFEEREAAYADIVSTYQHTIPNADELGGVLAQYTSLVDSLRPEPTAADLTAPDGSPTNLGIKLAMSQWLPAVWSSTFALLPYDLSFVTQTIRVASVRKIACAPAPEGGHWCDFDLRLDGEFPFLDLLSLMPANGRFVLQSGAWTLVETPGGNNAAQDSDAAWEEWAAQQEESNQFWSDYYQDNMVDLMMMLDD